MKCRVLERNGKFKAQYRGGWLWGSWICIENDIPKKTGKYSRKYFPKEFDSMMDAIKALEGLEFEVNEVWKVALRFELEDYR